MSVNANRARQLQIVTRLSRDARAALEQDRRWRRSRRARASGLTHGVVSSERTAALASLHAAVAAEPRDLRLRKIYAEMLRPDDPARSAFILHQLASTRYADKHQKAAWAILAEQVSYTDGARTWQDVRRWGWDAPFRDLDVHGEFNRGFLESVTIRASRFAALAPKIAAMAPIRSLKLSGDCGKDLPAILEHPFLRQIETLVIEDKLLDRQLQAIAAAPYLRGLKSLHVGPLLAGHQGLRALAGMPVLYSFAVGGGNDPLIAYEHDPDNFDCMTPPRIVRSPLCDTLLAEFGALPWMFADKSYWTPATPQRRATRR